MSPFRPLFLVAIVFTLTTQAQGQAQWQKYGPAAKAEEAQDLAQSPTGALYLLSTLDSNQWLGSDFGIYKLDSSGRQIWKHVYGQNGRVSANALYYHQHHLYVAGGLDINGQKKAFLSKIDSSGHLLWQKLYGQGDTIMQWLAIDAFPAGDLGLLAQYGPDSTKAAAALVARLDTAGVLKWRYFSQDTVDLVPHDIAISGSGHLYTVSDYEQPNRFDVLVHKVDPAGNFLAKKLITNGYTRGGNAIAIDRSGRIAIGGEGASALSVYFDITLSLLDSQLNLIRDVFVRPGVVKNDAAFGMTATDQGTFLYTGYRIAPENGNTEMIVVESDDLGQVLAQHNFCATNTCIGARIICNERSFWAIGNDFASSPSIILGKGQYQGLDLNQHSTPPIQLYPQPSSGYFELSLIPQGAVKIVDQMGRPVPFQRQGTRFAVPTLGSGYYSLILEAEGLSLPLLVK